MKDGQTRRVPTRNAVKGQGFLQVQLPDGYFVTYGGQFENLQEANQRLSVAVPAALALIFLLVIIFRRDGLLGQREIPLDRLFARGGELPRATGQSDKVAEL